jgi:general transcriptional corepressor CYC8
MHHGPPPSAPGIPPAQQAGWPSGPPSQQIAAMNEAVWLQIGKIITLRQIERFSRSNTLIGSFLEMIGNLDEATGAYEHALRANPRSIAAMNAISAILRTQEHFHKAVEYLNNILKLEPSNGDVWGSLGKRRICYIDKTHRSYMDRTLLFDDG